MRGSHYWRAARLCKLFDHRMRDGRCTRCGHREPDADGREVGTLIGSREAARLDKYVDPGPLPEMIGDGLTQHGIEFSQIEARNEDSTTETEGTRVMAGAATVVTDDGPVGIEYEVIPRLAHGTWDFARPTVVLWIPRRLLPGVDG